MSAGLLSTCDIIAVTSLPLHTWSRTASCCWKQSSFHCVVLTPPTGHFWTSERQRDKKPKRALPWFFVACFPKETNLIYHLPYDRELGDSQDVAWGDHSEWLKNVPLCVCVWGEGEDIWHMISSVDWAYLGLLGFQWCQLFSSKGDLMTENKLHLLNKATPPTPMLSLMVVHPTMLTSRLYDFDSFANLAYF